jgi:type IV pilus assembly protein PilP
VRGKLKLLTSCLVVNLFVGISAFSQVNETTKREDLLSSGDALKSSLGVSLDPFVYEQRGRRDPFVRPEDDRPVAPGQLHGPLLPLQRYELAQLTLIGVIWDVRRPRAMLKDADGNTHIVGPNAKIGPRNGYVAVIREGEIVVVETLDLNGKLISSAQVVKITK